MSDLDPRTLADQIDASLRACDLARDLAVAHADWPDHPPTLIEGGTTRVVAQFGFGRWDRDAEPSEGDEPYAHSEQARFDERVKLLFQFLAAAPGLLAEAAAALRSVSATPGEQLYRLGCRDPEASHTGRCFKPVAAPPGVSPGGEHASSNLATQPQRDASPDPCVGGFCDDEADPFPVRCRKHALDGAR